MDIAVEPKQNDITVENNGLSIFIQRDIEPFIKGTTIDFDERRGFFISGLQQSGCC